MAYQIVWAESALQDLRQIVSVISQDSPNAAARLAGRILDQVETASDMPYANRQVPEKGESSIREAIS